MQHYIPPVNFGMVEVDLYRSGHPNELNFPFLEKLKLKTVIYLASEDISEPLFSFPSSFAPFLHLLPPLTLLRLSPPSLPS